MPRKLKEIVAHLRACIADGSIKTTLIQTEDLAALCDAACGSDAAFSNYVEAAITPNPTRKLQTFEYYAAHFLVGSNLTGGDLDGHVRALSKELQKQYDIGVEHGMRAEAAPARSL